MLIFSVDFDLDLVQSYKYLTLTPQIIQGLCLNIRESFYNKQTLLYLIYGRLSLQLFCCLYLVRAYLLLAEYMLLCSHLKGCFR